MNLAEPFTGSSTASASPFSSSASSSASASATCSYPSSSSSSPPSTVAGGPSLAGRRLYLAVDCGGTKAAAAISISSPTPGLPPIFLSRGCGGAANYTDVGLWKFLKSVREAIEDAFRNAGIDWRHEFGTEKRQRISHAVAPGVIVGDDNYDLVDDSNPLARRKRCSVSSASSSTSSLSSRCSPAFSLAGSDRASSSTCPSSHGEAFAFPPIFHAAWLGVAGVDSPLNITALSPHLANLLSIPYPSPRLIVANDTSLLASPVMERNDGDEDIKEGVVAIAGTGSIVMSFRSRKQTQDTHQTQEGLYASPGNGNDLLEAVGRVGGLGWLLGDEASGYMVGRQAVRAVLDQADRDKLYSDGDDDDDYLSDEEEDVEDDVMQGDGAASVPEQNPHHHYRLFTDRPNDTTGTRTLLEVRTPNTRHLLRDRILQFWGLNSVDELLDAVYTDTPGVARPASTQSASSSRPVSQCGRSASDSIEDMTAILPPAVDEDTSFCPPSKLTLTSIDLMPSGMTEETEAQQDALKNFSLSLSEPSFSNPIPAPPSEAASLVSSPSSRHRILTRKPSSSTLGVGARKLRLASLAPEVFDLAFNHGDPLSLDILKEQIGKLVDQIGTLLASPKDGRSKARSRKDTGLSGSSSSHRTVRRRARNHHANLVQPDRSILCLGGSLLGVEAYRLLLEQELNLRGCKFQRIVHVEDVARRGCEALARSWEGRSILK